jgi:hypothetical protein
VAFVSYQIQNSLKIASANEADLRALLVRTEYQQGFYPVGVDNGNPNVSPL